MTRDKKHQLIASQALVERIEDKALRSRLVDLGAADIRGREEAIKTLGFNGSGQNRITT